MNLLCGERQTTLSQEFILLGSPLLKTGSENNFQELVLKNCAKMDSAVKYLFHTASSIALQQELGLCKCEMGITKMVSASDQRMKKSLRDLGNILM